MTHLSGWAPFSLFSLGSTGSRSTNEARRSNSTINARWTSGAWGTRLSISSRGARWTLLTRWPYGARQSLQSNQASVTL